MTGIPNYDRILRAVLRHGRPYPQGYMEYAGWWLRVTDDSVRLSKAEHGTIYGMWRPKTPASVKWMLEELRLRSVG